MQMFKNFIAARWWGLLLAALLVVLDIVTKLWALGLTDVIPVIDGFFNFRLAFNRGVSFSFLSDIQSAYLPMALGGLAFAVSIFFVWWMGHEDGKLFKTGVACMLGGALGNGMNRFSYGVVVDFLDFYYGSWHYPTFNVADIVIFIGVGCLLLDAFMNREQKEK